MWTNLVFSTVGIYTILNTQQAAEIFARVISTSLNGLTSSLTLMAYNNSNQTIKTYMEELELMDIEIKLRVIDKWLKSIDHNDIEPNSSLDIVYKGLADTCHQMSNLICIINHMITYHNSLWFSRWRSINIENEIKKIGRLSKILSDRIVLINIVGNKNSIEKRSCEMKTNDCPYMNLTNKEKEHCEPSDSTMLNNEPSSFESRMLLNNEPGETRLNDFTIL